jgi:hypothetical protein
MGASAGAGVGVGAGAGAGADACACSVGGIRSHGEIHATDAMTIAAPPILTAAAYRIARPC